MRATRKAVAEGINFAKGASHTQAVWATRAVVARRAINFGKVYTPKSDTPELSERNEEVRKRRGSDFGEKRL